MNANPEIGQMVQAGAVLSNHHYVGTGAALLLVHGRDDRVILLQSSRTPNQSIDDSACTYSGGAATGPRSNSHPPSCGWSMPF